MNKKEMLKTLFSFGGNSKRIMFWYVLRLLPSVLVFTGPLLTTLILDKYFPYKKIKMVFFLSFIYIILVILRTIQIFIYNQKRADLMVDEDKNIKNKIFNNIVKSKSKEIDSYHVGELISLNTTEAKNASLLFPWSYMRIYSIQYKNVFYTLIIMCFMDFRLSLLVIPIFFVSYFMLKPLYNKNRKIIKRLQDIKLELSSKSNEFVNSYSTNKTLRIEESNLSEIDELLKKTTNEVLKYNKLIYAHKYLFSFISFISTLIIVYVCGLNAISGISSLALVILFRNYIADLDNDMNVIVDFKNEANSEYSAYLKIYELCNLSKEENSGSLTLNKVSSIEFSHVKMSYDGVNDILKDINFKCERPIKIALVGKSGCGKSTLVNLLPRFYDISGGKIKINDINYLDYDLKSLRDNISYVFQEPVIFNMSILDNIKYGSKRKVTRDEVVDVCKKIGLHDKISSLEKGYDTLINIYTDKISYGEKQLLNFARAILKNSGILIMDEVTSNLDLEFEQKVMKATREVLKNKFSFIIAHRLKTIKNADIIVYIKDGVIKELGTHDELIKKNGYYKELYYSKKLENKE